MFGRRLEVGCAQFKRVFSRSIRLSSTTIYNWTNTLTSTMPVATPGCCLAKFGAYRCSWKNAGESARSAHGKRSALNKRQRNDVNVEQQANRTSLVQAFEYTLLMPTVQLTVIPVAIFFLIFDSDSFTPQIL
jgi:hypothetical protein